MVQPANSVILRPIVSEPIPTDPIFVSRRGRKIVDAYTCSWFCKLCAIYSKVLTKKGQIYKEKRLLFRWKRRESWATPLFLGNRRRRECNRFVEFASVGVIFRVSDVVATRFLRQISRPTQLSRYSSGINSFYARSEILSCDVEKVNLSTFYSNSALKDAFSSRRASCQHFFWWKSTFRRDFRDSKLSTYQLIWLLFERCRRKKACYPHCR